MTQDMPPWIEVAERYLGQHEISGALDNDFIIECLDISGAPPELLHDETAWCRAFVNRCLHDSGYRFTRSLAALDIAKHPDVFLRLDTFRPGCITLYDRVDPKAPTVPHGHSAFGLMKLRRNIVSIGGNQSNAVCIEPRSIDKLHAGGCYFWPAGVP